MFTVERYSFYYSSVGTRRFAEYDPPKKDCDHQVCNCTRNITIRPIEEPDQLSQTIKFIDKFGKYSLDFNLSSNWTNFGFFWDEQPYEEGFRWKNPHASFDFNHVSTAGGKLKNSISISIHKPGFSKNNYFFANVYFGNNIDISKFFNGHSESRIVKLETIKFDQVWCHSCGTSGKETMSFFVSKEANLWQQLYCHVSQIINITDSESLSKSVSEVNLKISNNKELLNLILSSRDYLFYILNNLEETELFKNNS